MDLAYQIQSCFPTVLIIFFNPKRIEHLFTVVNKELVNIKNWFTHTHTHSSVSQVRKKYKEKNLSSSFVFYQTKSIGNLYKARPYLDKRALLSLCNSCIHSYLSYPNAMWCSSDHGDKIVLYLHGTVVQYYISTL